MNIKSFLFNNPGQPSRTDTDYSEIVRYTLNSNLLSYEYNNGTHPDNVGYETNNGYKKTTDSRTNNVDDGWYIIETGEIWNENTFNQPAEFYYSFTVIVRYITGGKITQSKIITITK